MKKGSVVASLDATLLLRKRFSRCPVHHPRSQLRRQHPQRARARDRVLLLGQLLPRVDASEPEGAYRRRPAPGRGKRGLQSPAHSKPRRAELHQGPAKEITFDFSAPVEDSSGFVLSDLRFFKEGLPFLKKRRRRSPTIGTTCRTSYRCSKRGD